MTTHRLEPLLNPSSIAIIGASNNPGRIGGMPLALLSEFNYQGQVYPINPKYETAFTYPCWPAIESVPYGIDLVVLAIGANDVLPMLQRCHAHGVKAAIVYAAGFAEESGTEGHKKQQQITDFANSTGMLIAGPNCMGLANLNTQAHTAFASVFKTAPMQTEPGKVSLLTQSGNVCSALYGLLRERQLPISQFINTGNEAALDFTDYLSYLAQDPNTETIVGYIEELRDGVAFKDICQQLHKANKLFIALKAGTTEKGAQAVQSHTSALAGNKKVYAAAFKQLGVIAANDFAQMANIAYLAQFKHKKAGSRVALVTMSGALGAILADRFTEVGIQIPTLSESTQHLLRASIPSYGMVTNPVDVTGNVVNTPELTQQILNTLAQSNEIDCVVVYAPGYMLDRMAQQLASISVASNQLFVAIDTGQSSERSHLEKAGVPVFTDIGQAVAALGPFLLWQDYQSNITNRVSTAKSTSAPTLASIPSEIESLQYLQHFGIHSPPYQVVQTVEKAIKASESIGFPLVLKVVSADIPHKTEAGGVRLNIHNTAQLNAAFTQITNQVKNYAPHAKIDGVMVQAQDEGIAELLVGISQDATFGPTLTIGLGGTYTELYQDTAHALLPVNKAQIITMLEGLIAYPLLTGFRGKAKVDMDNLAQTILALTRAYEAQQSRIVDIEVNPLLVKEKSTVALDALIICT